ncbi:hypothetical protein ACFPYJ_16165 [Paenibacillus solisilvae]|uniref:Uncharacterized protein n=1 Tax=Paenibacillus solisilvae TaxID=2486751 RepID=A0ABW0VXQ3_9BACL
MEDAGSGAVMVLLVLDVDTGDADVGVDDVQGVDVEMILMLVLDLDTGAADVSVGVLMLK